METRQIVRKLLTGSILRSFSLVSSVLIAFFMMPFLVHSLGDEQYGLWVVVGSLVGFYGFFDLGLSAAVGKYTANAVGRQDYISVNHIVNTALVLFGMLGLGVIALSVIGATLIYFFKDGDNTTTFALMFIIMGTNIGLQFPLRTFSGILSSQMRFDLLVYVELFKLFTRTVLGVTFVLHGFGVLTLAVITFAVEMLGNILEFILMKRNAMFIRFKRKYFQRHLIKQLALYSWAAFVTNVSETARCKLVPVFVASFLGIGYVVIYSIALRLLEYFELLMRNCIGFMMPVLSRFEGEENSSLMKKTFTFVTVLTVMTTMFIGASIVFYGKPFIMLWMGDQYIQSYDVLLIMLVPMMLIVMQLPAKDLLFAVSKHQVYAFLSAGGVIMMSLLCVATMHTTQINTIAYGFLFGIVVFELIKPYYVARTLNENVLEIYGLYVLTMLKSAGILGLFAIFVYTHTIASYLEILFFVTLQGIIFTLLGYFFIIPKQLKSVIQTMIILPTIRKVCA